MGKKGAFLYIYFIAVLATLGLAFITILASWASHQNPNSVGLIAFLGLAIPALLFANCICLLYWNIRWKIWVWIPLIAILSNFSYINSMYQFSFDKKDNYKNTITILSYNVHGFRSASTSYCLDDIIQFMSNPQIDIVCLQEYAEDEYCNRNKIIQKMKAFPYFTVKKNCAKGFGLAIYSKFPIIEEVGIPFKNSLNGAIWADIKINKKTVRIFNSHLQTTNINQTKDLLKKNSPDGFLAAKKHAVKMILNKMNENAQKRANQIDNLVQIIDTTKCPIIFCGDFNDTPASYAYHNLNKHLDDGFVSAGNGFGNTFRYFHRLLRIDYIFHSKNFKGVRYDSPSIDYSDHNPVIMELTIQ